MIIKGNNNCMNHTAVKCYSVFVFEQLLWCIVELPEFKQRMGLNLKAPIE